MFWMLHCSFCLILRFIYLCCDKVCLGKLLLFCAIQILIVFNEDPHKVKGRSQIFNVYSTMEKWGKATMSVHYSPDIVKSTVGKFQLST